jgi:hypothetical protein
MKHISGFFPIFALVLSACGRAPEPPQASAPAAKLVAQNTHVARGESSTQSFGAPCPVQWTCDHQRWFTTQAACTASCGPSCFLEEHDTGSCVPR